MVDYKTVPKPGDTGRDGKPPWRRVKIGSEDSPGGRRVIEIAQDEARRLGHNFIGSEQILLGLIGEGRGVAAQTLKYMGVNFNDARVEVQKIIGYGSGFVSEEIPFTPRAKRVLELSWDEARQFGHNYVGTEHLLLGLIRDGDGVAARVLEKLGVDSSKVRSHVIRLLSDIDTDA